MHGSPAAESAATTTTDGWSRWQRLGLVVASGAVAVCFLHVLLFDGRLLNYDWRLHFHYYDWIRISLTQHGVLPFFMANAYHSQNFLANAQTPVFGPMLWLLHLVPTDVYIKGIIVVYTTVGLVGMMLLLRDLRVAAPIALAATLAYGFNGFFAAHLSTGHHWALGCYLLPGLVCAFRRAALGSVRALWVGVLLNTLTILEGFHHPFIWQNVFLVLVSGFWAGRERSTFPLKTCAILIAATAGLGAVRLLPIIFDFYDFAPKSFVPGFTPRALGWSLIAPGQSVATAADGLGSIKGNRWWEYAFYVGAPVTLFIIVGLIPGRKRSGAILLAGFVLLLAALDLSRLHPALDIWRWLQQVPLAMTQRVPSRLLIVVLFAVLVTSSVGIQALWERWRGHHEKALKIAIVAFIVIIGADLYVAGRSWHAGAHAPKPVKLGEYSLEARLGGGHRVSPERVEPNRIAYRVDLPEPALLMLPFFWRDQGNWRIRDFEIERADRAMAVRVPAGEQLVELVYRPRGLFVGLAISLLTATIGAVHFAFATRRRNLTGSSTPIADTR